MTTTSYSRTETTRLAAALSLQSDVSNLARMIADDSRRIGNAADARGSNWSHIGDLARVREVLVEALARMNGTEIADVEFRVRACDA